MNNELEQSLTQFLTASLKAVEKGVNIAGEQIPLVLQEIIQWKIASSALQTVIFFVLAMVSFFALKWGIKRLGTQDDELAFGCVILGGASLLVSLLIFGNAVFHLAKVLSAPRLVIIEFLKGML